MLTDPIEIEIISRARQKNVRNPNRSRTPFERIFDDFLPHELFGDAHLIDLGPGQFDFAEMARERGAAKIVGFDNDPAVIELGWHKGFDMTEGRLQELRADAYPNGFDGVFCKFSINAFWATNEQGVRRHVEQLAGLLRSDAWSWIAPWNGANAEAWTEGQIATYLQVQAASFREHGYEAIDLGDELARYYGVHGAVANHALFTRNLNLPKRVAACSPL